MIHCQYEDGDQTWERLKFQVGRLENFDKFPWEKAALRDLTMALASADSIEEATEVVDGFARYHKGRCPLPATLREAINALHERSGKPAAAQDGECRDCGGKGYHYKVVLQWRERQEDGSVKIRKRYVPDEENGIEEARAMKPEKEATCYPVTVDCSCRKKSEVA